jgi:hypothetical protein
MTERTERTEERQQGWPGVLVFSRDQTRRPDLSSRSFASNISVRSALSVFTVRPRPRHAVGSPDLGNQLQRD